MRALVAVTILLAGCANTIHDDFLDVTPVAKVPALAGKSLTKMDGARCKSICSTRRAWESINYCVVATLEAGRHLSCRVRRNKDNPAAEAFDVLVEIPETVDQRTLPASGPVSNELCLIAGCRGHAGVDNDPVIDGCSIYPYHPDRTEQFLVCSYHDTRAPTTM